MLFEFTDTSMAQPSFDSSTEYDPEEQRPFPDYIIEHLCRAPYPHPRLRLRPQGAEP